MKRYRLELTELELVELTINIRHMMEKNIVEHFDGLSKLDGVNEGVIEQLQNISRFAKEQCEFLKKMYERGELIDG